jgi:predicted alpha/beta hydrolase
VCSSDLLPAGVVGQWASWCNTTGYARGALETRQLHYDEVHGPMVFIDVADDDYAPASASAELRSWYRHARREHLVVRPADLGMDKVGHFGVFRPGAVQSVWDHVAARILLDAGGRSATPAAHAS